MREDNLETIKGPWTNPDFLVSYSFGGKALVDLPTALKKGAKPSRFLLFGKIRSMGAQGGYVDISEIVQLSSVHELHAGQEPVLLPLPEDHQNSIVGMVQPMSRLPRATDAEMAADNLDLGAGLEDKIKNGEQPFLVVLACPNPDDGGSSYVVYSVVKINGELTLREIKK